jgi:DNA polymerase-3 subunit beta
VSPRIALGTDDLRAAADWVCRLCPAKPTTPILQGVLVEADERLTLSATDWDTAGSVTLSAGVLEPGRALIPGRLLTGVAKTFGRGEVVITCAREGIDVKAGRDSWRLPALAVEDYPKLPQPGKPLATVDGAALRRCLGRVLSAADREGSVRFAGSVAVVGDESGLTLCATDSYRLAVCTIPWQPTGDPVLDILAPVDFLDAAVRAAEGSAVELSTDGHVVALATDEHRLTGRLTATDWPKWQGLLPKSHAAQSTFVVDDLLAAVGRVMAVSDEKTPIRLDVDAGGFELTVSGDDRAGHAFASVSDYESDEESRMVALNPVYLRQALTTLDADLAVMRFGAKAASPLDLVPLDGGGEPETGYKYLLMPLKLSVLERAA